MGIRRTTVVLPAVLAALLAGAPGAGAAGHELELAVTTDRTVVTPSGPGATVTVTATNTGEAPAQDVEVEFDLSDDHGFELPEDCTVDVTTATCPVDGLQAGESADVVVQLLGGEEGTWSATFVASSPGSEDATAESPPIDVTRTDGAERLAGPDRIGTALAISGQWDAGSVSDLVLARSDVSADALVGGPLAHQEGAPLLLTPGDQLDPRVRDEIRRLVPAGGAVHVLGGEEAISEQVVEELRDLGLVVRRYAGEDRYATAVMVADALERHDTIWLADGIDGADATVAGPAAINRSGVVLLTAGDEMPSATQDWLDARPDRPTYAVGGPAAAAAPSATALVGADRHATSLAVANELAGAEDFGLLSSLGFARGDDPADALTLAPYLGVASGSTFGGPAPVALLLTPHDALPDGAADLIVRNRTRLYALLMAGGPVALSEDVEAEINAVFRDEVSDQ